MPTVDPTNTVSRSSVEHNEPETDWLFEKLNSNLLIQIFEATSDGVWVCDATPRLLWINSTCEKLNDIQRKDVIGKTVEELLGSGNFDHDVTHQVLTTRQPTAIVQKVKSGRTLLVNGAPVFDANGNVQFVVGTERDLTELNLSRQQLEDSKQLQKKIQSELTALSIEKFGSDNLIASSEVMTNVLETCVRVAHFDSTVLLTGQSGTGKSMVAGFIHKTSNRGDKAFLSLNCGAIPAGLVEAELFGYVDGAFSGAQKGGKPGLIEAADGGTLFLDEIDSFSLDLQVKLLTFLDTQRFIRVGDNKVKQVDVRLVVATNQNLQDKVAEGKFREDLLYRLNVLPLELPPLKDRTEDIPLLVRHALKKLSTRYEQQRTITRDAVDMLCRYDYPGNVRELQNILERSFVLCPNEEIGVNDLPKQIKDSVSVPRQSNGNLNYQQAMKNLELHYLTEACLKHNRQQGIAEELGVSQPTVARLLKKHNLKV